jgi:hypothetical protein
MSFIKYLNAPMAIIIYLIAFVFCCFFIWKKILYDLDIKIKKWNVNFFLFTIMLLCGLWVVYKDVLFWLTGGAYMLMLLQGIFLTNICLNLIDTTETKPVKKIYIVFSFVLIFILSLNTQNLMIAIMVFNLIYIFQKKKNIFNNLILIILPIILGMIFVSMAPGNFIRINKEQPDLNLSIMHILSNAISIYAKFLVQAKTIIIAALLFGFYIFYFQIQKRNSLLFYLKRISLFTFLSLLSLSPFIFVPVLARIRVFFVALVFLFIAVVYLAICISGYLKVVYFKHIVAASILFFLLFAIKFMYVQDKLLYNFAKEVKIRADYLESKRGSNEIVTYKRLIIPDSLYIIRWADYKNYGDWDKVKEYYNLKDYIELE